MLASLVLPLLSAHLAAAAPYHDDVWYHRADSSISALFKRDPPNPNDPSEWRIRTPHLTFNLVA